MGKLLTDALAPLIARSQRWVAETRRQVSAYGPMSEWGGAQALLQRLRERLGPSVTGEADAPAMEEFDAADWALLPRQPGWHRRDWTPSAEGPIRALTLHCQTSPDPVEGADTDSAAASVWRFEAAVAYSHGQAVTIVGRLDHDGLRLLVRADQGLGQAAQAHVTAQVAKMRLEDGLPVSIRYDGVREPIRRLARRSGVDHRA